MARHTRVKLSQATVPFFIEKYFYLEIPEINKKRDKILYRLPVFA